VVSQRHVDASYILGICYIQIKDYPRARGAFAKMFVSRPICGQLSFHRAHVVAPGFGPIA